MDTSPPYYTRLAAAFVRGHAGLIDRGDENSGLFCKPLDELPLDSLSALVELGLQNDLRLHRFKRTMGLPRVQRVLGVLRGFQPGALLDIGSGRGAFLWPLLEAFPDLPVTAMDRLDHRAHLLGTVARGGVRNLSALQGDAMALPFRDGSFDIVTLLEVLEHLPQPEQAVAELCRVARRAIILSVPSRPDDNPEHIHLFDETRLRDVFARAGSMKPRFERVLNHIVIVASRGEK